MTRSDLPSPGPSCPPGKDFHAGSISADGSPDSAPPARAAALFANRRAYFAFNTRTAIRAACDVLGLAPGDEVLVPAYNCGSEIDPLLHAGLRVAVYPVGRDLIADPDAIARLLSPRTRAVYVTHYFGLLQPRLARIRALCDARGLRLMEDCALSLLSGQHPAEGRTGDVSFFCFHKFFPVPGGSALVINADDLRLSPAFDRPPLRRAEIRFMARRILGAVVKPDHLRRARRAFGGAPADQALQAPGTKQDIPGHYYFDPDLTGRRMSGLTANALRHADLDAAIRRRRRNWQIYREFLVEVPQAEPLIPDLPHAVCPHSMPVLIPDRDRIAAKLQAAGFGVTAWWAGFHQGLDWSAAGGALALKDGVLSLPLEPHLTRADLARLVARMKLGLAA